MSWLGTGAPVLHVNGTAHTFPRPVEGGMADQMFVPEVQDVWTNLDGEMLEGELRWRVEEKLTWISLTALQIEQLAAWFTNRATVGYQPHSDVSRVYNCRIMDMENPRGIVTSDHEEVTIELKSIQLINALPQPTLGTVGRLKTGVI